MAVSCRFFWKPSDTELLRAGWRPGDEGVDSVSISASAPVASLSASLEVAVCFARPCVFTMRGAADDSLASLSFSDFNDSTFL